jgi:hypothetical protein
MRVEPAEQVVFAVLGDRLAAATADRKGDL